jgi:mRNA-degrading endonuclease toxin of MazEF toxin-antitoxin module
MNPKPGEVWLVDLGLAAKTRTVVVVSRYDPTPPRAGRCLSSVGWVELFHAAETISAVGK